jgi:phosphoribosyl-AMP cyclohydrolase
MDLSIVKKPLPAILMNCDNQTVIVKVDSSKDNITHQKTIKVCQKNEKLRVYYIGLYPY